MVVCWTYVLLTSEEIESLVTKVRDYQLGITVSDEDNSISAKATKCRDVESLSGCYDGNAIVSTILNTGLQY